MICVSLKSGFYLHFTVSKLSCKVYRSMFVIHFVPDPIVREEIALLAAAHISFLYF